MSPRALALAAELRPHLPAEPAPAPMMFGPDGVENLRAMMAAGEEEPAVVATATGVDITEMDADGVPVFVLRPPALAPLSPAVFSIHGGGMIGGSYRNSLTHNALLAAELGLVMVVPEYRVAPEHPYPAPIDDVDRAWSWLERSSEALDVDPRRIVIVGGSSGGLLAATLALRIRRRGGPAAKALVLVQPQLDDRNTLPSTHQFLQEYYWDRPSNLEGWALYLAGRPADAETTPARESDLSGLPSTYIEIGQADLFRDECLEFASRLSADGVPVELHVWSGAFHGFDGLTQTVVAQRAVAARTEFLRAAIAG